MKKSEQNPIIGALYRLRTTFVCAPGLWLFHSELKDGPIASSEYPCNEITLPIQDRTHVPDGTIVMVTDWHIDMKLSNNDHVELVVSLLTGDKVLSDVGFERNWFFDYFERVS